MKNNRKIIVVFALSLIFCIALATPVFAESTGEDPAITAEEILEEALPGEESCEQSVPAPEEELSEGKNVPNEETEAEEAASAEGNSAAAAEDEFPEEGDAAAPEENANLEDGQTHEEDSGAEAYITFDGKYVLRLGESADLAEILDSLGIDADEGISSVTCSDPGVIAVEKDGESCRISSTGKAFIDEILYVTAGGREYAIALHDPMEVASFSELKTCLQMGSELEIKLTSDVDLSEPIIVHGIKILDLFGHTLKAVNNAISITLGNSQTEMTVKDSSQEKTGKIDGNGKNMTINNPGSLTLSGITVTGIDGGNISPIYNDIGTLMIDGCTFSDCTGNKGGVVNNESTAVISNSTFTGCTATNGGAVLSCGADLTVTDCVFTGCTATSEGGAIFAVRSENKNGTANISGSTFTGCTAAAGGAISIDGAAVTLNSDTITGCSAEEVNLGGAICFSSGSLKLIGESGKDLRIFGNTSGGKENNIMIGSPVISPELSGTFSEGTRVGFYANSVARITFNEGCEANQSWFDEPYGFFFSDDPNLVFVKNATEKAFVAEIDNAPGIKIRPQTDDRLIYGDTESKITYRISIINDDRTPTLNPAEDYDLELTSANGEYLLTLSLSSVKAAGNHTLLDVVKLSGDALQNESCLRFTVVPKELGVAWTDGTLTYDGEAQLPGYELSGVLEGDDCAIQIADAQGKPLAAVDAGSYTAYVNKLTGASKENYKLPANGLTKKFTINRKEVTLIWGTADFTYNGKNQVPAVTMTDFISGDNVEIEVSGAAKDAGTYSGSKAAKAVLTGENAGNYALPENNTCDFVIGQKQLAVTGTVAEDKIYDGTTTATFSNDGELVGLVSGDIVTLGVSGSFDNANAGNSKSVTVYYSVSGNAMKNYIAPSEESVTASINPKEVTLIWGTADFTYNGKNQVPAVTMTDFISGDDVEIEVSGAAKDVGTYSGSKAAKAVLTGENAGNYALPENNTCDFVIGQKQLAVTGTVAEDKIYDGTTTATFSNDGELVGLVSGDIVTLGVSGSFDNANAGNSKSVTVYYTISGEAMNNYAAPSDDIVTASVNPKPVTVKWGTNVFTYDTDSHAPTADSDNFINEDDVEILVAGMATNAGVYTATATGLNGTDAGNYALPEQTPTCGFTIKPMPLGDDAVDPISSVTYTGEALTPEVTARDRFSTLTMDTDYSVSYSNNKEAGNANAKVTFKGNYIGEADQPFTINKNSGNKFTTEPVASQDLGTDGTTAALLLEIPAEAEFGTVLYSIDGGNTWSEVSPEVKKAGTYEVMYKVDDTDSYNGLNGSLTVMVKNTASPAASAAGNAVTTTDEGRSAEVRIIGTVAEIVVTDKDGKPVSPDNVTIVSPAVLIANGVGTAEIRMSDTLTVEIALKAAMGGRNDCVITIDNVDGVISVRCNGVVLFEADLTDIADRIARLVYDGKTVKAIDADGRVIAEFELS